MAINERLIHTAADAAAGAGTGNQEDGLVLHLDANDVDSYDGDGSIWYDIKDHEYTPATNVSEHFNTVTYTGNGSTSRAVTGIGFQPDMVWVKRRDAAAYHLIQDSLRGANKSIFPNDTLSEQTDQSSGHVDSFDSDGFTVDVANSGNTNASGSTYVAWCFKAGGAAVSNTDGSITSSVSVNTDLGFSIAKYEGTGVSGDTFGHGLGVKPDMAIVKETSASGNNWHVYVNGITSDTKDLRLNSTNALTSVSSSRFIHADIDSSVIALGNSGGTNTNNSDYIAYCFASKRGVSKVGSYTGTGAAGNKVYTGFEPAWIMMKRTSSAGSGWYIVDNKRDTNTNKNKYFSADSNAAEATSGSSITFNKDGFTFNGGSFNTSGHTHIYLAFAKDTNETELHDTDPSSLELHLDAASFDGSTNTPTTWNDSSGNGNNGTISGATFDSELGNWLDLERDNNSHNVTVADSSSLDISTNITLEAWINPESNTSYGRLFWKSGAYALYLGTNGWTFLLGATSLNHNSNIPSTGTWYHIAATYDGSNQKLYINGELVDTEAMTGGIPTNNNPLYIGGIDSARFFDGKIGQTRIYSSALSQDQIRQNFNFTKNDYPNGFNGTNSGLSFNPSGYFTYDSTSDKSVITNGKQKGIVPNSSTDTTTLIWARIHSTSPLNYILTGRSSSIKNFYFRHYLNNLTLAIYNDGGTRDINENFGSLSANTWYLLGFRTTTDGNVRVNVITTGTSTFTDATATMSSYESTDVDFNIGFYQTGNGFDGDIGAVKVYNKYLSDSEITAYFDATKDVYGL